MRFATGLKFFTRIAATIEAWLLRQRLPRLFAPLWWMNGSPVEFDMQSFRPALDQLRWRLPLRIALSFKFTSFMTNAAQRLPHWVSAKHQVCRRYCCAHPELPLSSFIPLWLKHITLRFQFWFAQQIDLPNFRQLVHHRQLISKIFTALLSENLLMPK